MLLTRTARWLLASPATRIACWTPVSAAPARTPGRVQAYSWTVTAPRWARRGGQRRPRRHISLLCARALIASTLAVPRAAHAGHWTLKQLGLLAMRGPWAGLPTSRPCWKVPAGLRRRAPSRVRSRGGILRPWAVRPAPQRPARGRLSRRPRPGAGRTGRRATSAGPPCRSPARPPSPRRLPRRGLIRRLPSRLPVAPPAGAAPPRPRRRSSMEPGRMAPRSGRPRAGV